MAGSIGGFNAHAANVITAIYIATGQVRIQPFSKLAMILSLLNAGRGPKRWKLQLHNFDGALGSNWRGPVHDLLHAQY